MKVSHLVLSDQFGAGRAATRICEAEKECGVDAVLYAFYCTDENTRRIELSPVERLKKTVYKRMDQYYTQSLGPRLYFHMDSKAVDLLGRDYIREADIIHFHWLNEGLFSFDLLEKLSAMKKPVVWTLHDSWAFTGGCHLPIGCEQFKAGCHYCRFLDRNNSAAEMMLKRKEKAYNQLSLAFVACSNWMMDNAKESSVCKCLGLNCTVIPNPADTEVFHPLSRNVSRSNLNIDSDNKLILVGASNLNDPIKGMRYLYDTLHYLNPSEYSIACFGNGSEFHPGGYHVYDLGYLDNEHLAMAYNVCDVFVAPSTYDNLPNTVMEALACGTPVAAFNIGGMPDMIIPGKNGYLAEPFDPESLAQSIMGCAGGNMDRRWIAQDADNRFSYKTVGDQYKELYEDILKNND